MAERSVYPPAAVCDDLERFLAGRHLTRAADLGVNVRPAQRGTWHITLCFLGEVADDRLPDVAAAIGKGVAAWRLAILPRSRNKLQIGIAAVHIV